jgi:hypothetical protein
MIKIMDQEKVWPIPQSCPNQGINMFMVQMDRRYSIPIPGYDPNENADPVLKIIGDPAINPIEKLSVPVVMVMVLVHMI